MSEPSNPSDPSTSKRKRKAVAIPGMISGSDLQRKPAERTKESYHKKKGKDARELELEMSHYEDEKSDSGMGMEMGLRLGMGMGMGGMSNSDRLISPMKPRGKGKGKGKAVAKPLDDDYPSSPASAHQPPHPSFLPIPTIQNEDKHDEPASSTASATLKKKTATHHPAGDAYPPIHGSNPSPLAKQPSPPPPPTQKAKNSKRPQGPRPASTVRSLGNKSSLLGLKRRQWQDDPKASGGKRVHAVWNEEDGAAGVGVAAEGLQGGSGQGLNEIEHHNGAAAGFDNNRVVPVDQVDGDNYEDEDEDDDDSEFGEEEKAAYGRIEDVTAFGLPQLPPNTLLRFNYTVSCAKAPEEPQAENLSDIFIIRQDPLAGQPETVVYQAEQADVAHVGVEALPMAAMGEGDVLGGMVDARQSREVVSPRGDVMKVAIKVQYLGAGVSDRQSSEFKQAKDIRKEIREQIPAAQRDREIVGPVLALGAFAYLLPGSDDWVIGHCRASIRPLYKSYKAATQKAIDEQDLSRYKRLTTEAYKSVALFNKFRVHYDLKPENFCLEEYKQPDGTMVERVVLIDVEGAKKLHELLDTQHTQFTNTWMYSSVPLVATKIAQMLEVIVDDPKIWKIANEMRLSLCSASYERVLPQADHWTLGIIMIRDTCPRYSAKIYTVASIMRNLFLSRLTGIARVNEIKRAIEELGKIFSFTYDHKFWKKELEEEGNAFNDTALFKCMEGCLKRPEVAGILRRVAVKDQKNLDDLYAQLEESIKEPVLLVVESAASMSTTPAPVKQKKALTGAAKNLAGRKELRNAIFPDKRAGSGKSADTAVYLVRGRHARVEWSAKRSCHDIIVEGRHSVDKNAVVFVRISGVETDFVVTNNEKSKAWQYRCNKPLETADSFCQFTTDSIAAMSDHVKTCVNSKTQAKIKTSMQLPNVRGDGPILPPNCGILTYNAEEDEAEEGHGEVEDEGGPVNFGAAAADELSKLLRE